MARQKSRKLENAFIGLAIVIGAIAWIISTVVKAVGTVFPVVVVVLLIAGAIWFRHAQRQKRIEYLLDKYGDQSIVQGIMNRKFWQGQTAEQLKDSIGSPLSIDNKVMATRKRQVWKYRQTGRNRYALRITLDNDIVIGWDQKHQ